MFLQYLLYLQYLQVTAEEALAMGLVLEVVPHNSLLDRAQELAEQWVREGRVR